MIEDKLPPVVLIDLGDAILWHRVSEVEQLMYKYLKKKEKDNDRRNNKY